MWQLKLGASALGIKKPSFGGSSEPDAHDPNNPKGIAKYARFGAATTSIMLLLLGVVSAFLFSIAVGVVCAVLSPFIVLLELPYVPLSFLAIIVTFFQDYRFKVVFYVAICLPGFFSIPTIFAGIASLITAVLYGIAAFLNESGKKVEQTDWKRNPLPKSEEQQAKPEQKKSLTEAQKEEEKKNEPKQVEIKVEQEESIQPQQQKSSATSSSLPEKPQSKGEGDKRNKKEGTSTSTPSSSKKEKGKGFLGNVTNMGKSGISSVSNLVSGKKKSSLASQDSLSKV